ncbi:MAG: twin-arginine translocase subunit TatC [Acidiferrobacterales bacterium]
MLELRNRLLYAVIAVGVIFLGLLPFANTVYSRVAQPLISVLPKGASMIATDVTSPFLTPIKLTLAVAIVVAIPFILYQLWAFVAPGLYRHERRLILPLLVSSTVLFYTGMAFAYFVIFPMVFRFFVHSLPAGVTMMTDIRSYLNFVFSMFFAFGIAFELPVAVVLLAWMGILNPDSLGKKRPYVILVVFIIAAFLTPPDVFSQTFLAVPMLLLFEIGLFFARRVVRAKNARAQAAAAKSGEAAVAVEPQPDGQEKGRAARSRRRGSAKSSRRRR